MKTKRAPVWFSKSVAPTNSPHTEGPYRVLGNLWRDMNEVPE